MTRKRNFFWRLRRRWQNLMDLTDPTIDLFRRKWNFEWPADEPPADPGPVLPDTKLPNLFDPADSARKQL